MADQAQPDLDRGQLEARHPPIDNRIQQLKSSRRLVGAGGSRSNILQGKPQLGGKVTTPGKNRAGSQPEHKVRQQSSRSHKPAPTPRIKP